MIIYAYICDKKVEAGFSRETKMTSRGHRARKDSREVRKMPYI